MRTFLLITGLLLLMAIEILRVYFIMPFPGSQQSDTLDFAYWLHNNIFWLRLLGVAMVAWPLTYLAQKGRPWPKAFATVGVVLYAVVFYFFNYRFLAEKMFYQPTNKIFLGSAYNAIDSSKLVLGIEINGEAKAYPIQLIGYHHQVRDTVGNTSVMVTYCTVCRTGRVFSPIVNGKEETFRLVGMDRFNAMFEDASTESWWMQATGEAVAGPLKGMRLTEIPSQQMTLSSWLRQYPQSLVMQLDTLFSEEYEALAKFDKGIGKSHLTKRDSTSWQFKSWVVGIEHGRQAKAYDWNELVDKKIIQDSMPNLPLVIILEPDSASFHAFNRCINGTTLHFEPDSTGLCLIDKSTATLWSLGGVCLEGSMKGQQLLPVKASQEFWHSWQTFHPKTTR
jgi:Protein of unknown function (DUF3179).